MGIQLYNKSSHVSPCVRDAADATLQVGILRYAVDILRATRALRLGAREGFARVKASDVHDVRAAQPREWLRRGCGDANG